MNEPVDRGLLAPHPVLGEFYGESDCRAAFVRRLFNETAPTMTKSIGFFRSAPAPTTGVVASSARACAPA